MYLSKAIFFGSLCSTVYKQHALPVLRIFEMLKDDDVLTFELVLSIPSNSKNPY